MKVLKTIAILVAGLCITSDAWSGSNAKGRSCAGKYKSERACNADKACTWNRGEDMCLAACSNLALDACGEETKSCGVMPAMRGKPAQCIIVM